MEHLFMLGITFLIGLIIGIVVHTIEDKRKPKQRLNMSEQESREYAAFKELLKSAAEQKEDIPWQVGLIGFRDLTDEEIEYGKSLEPLVKEMDG